MSCGEPHEIDCTQVLQEVYLFMDREADDDERAKIQRHLDECAPCLREFGIEEEVKSLVHRCCGNEKAPEALRSRLRVQLSVALTEVRPPAEQ